MFKIYKGGETFYQWDIGQRLLVEDATITTVHFCNKLNDCALTCNVYEENGIRLVNVPNILLQATNCIRVYGCISEGTTINYAKEMQIFRVIARNQPEGFVYTEEDIKSLDSLEQKVEELEELVENLPQGGGEIINTETKTIKSPSMIDIPTDADIVKVTGTSSGYYSGGYVYFIFIDDANNILSATQLVAGNDGEYFDVSVELNIPNGATKCGTHPNYNGIYYEADNNYYSPNLTVEFTIGNGINIEQWIFTLNDGTTITKNIVLN